MSQRARVAVIAAVVAAGVAIARPEAGQIAVPQVRVPVISVPRAPVVGVPGTTVNPTLQPRDTQPRGPRRLTLARAQAFVEAARRGLNYLPGEVIVKFKPGTGVGGQQRALESLRSRPSASDLEWRGEIAIVRDESQPDAWILAQQLSSQPEVEYAEPNFIATIDPLVKEGADGGTPFTGRVVPSRARPAWLRTAATPTDTDFAAYQWNFTLINMMAAWDIQPGGRTDLIAAVIDTGITVSPQNLTFPLWTGSSFQNVSLPFAVNPDLPASRLVLPRDYAFLTPAGPVLDLDGHGTHVSGTIAQATNNGVLVAGMAYNVKIMPVKVCDGYWEVMITRAQNGITGFAPTNAGGCAFTDVAEGVRYAADNGAKVMNISLGGSSASITLRDALAYAVGKGAFIAISMGNGFETGNVTNYPARYAADFDGAMSVASIAKNLTKAYYSSTGFHCEIAAPGGDSRQGVGTTDRGLIWQSTLLTGDVSPFLTVPRFDRYDKQPYQGTSMAAPHVTGLAALLFSQMPDATPAQIEKIIRETAKDLGADGKDDAFGYGLIQPRAALFGLGVRK